MRTTPMLMVLAMIILVSCSQTPQQGPVRIGIITPLTGWGEYWGQHTMKGAQLATQDIQATYGEAPVLLLEDSASSAKGAVTAANKLISVDNADAFYVEFTSASAAVSPVSRENRKVLIYDGFAPHIVQDNPYAFKFYLDPAKECEAMMRYAKAQGYSNIAVMLLQNDISPPCKERVSSVAQELGMQYHVYDFSEGEKDYRVILTKVKDSGAQVMIGLMYEDNALALLQQRDDLKMNIPLYCSRSDCYTDTVVRSLPASSVEGGFNFDIKVSPEFEQKYKERVNPGPTVVELQATAMSYDAVMYLYLASRQCPNHDGDCMKEAMLHVQNYTSAIQSDSFNAARILTTRAQYGVYRNGTNEKVVLG